MDVGVYVLHGVQNADVCAILPGLLVRVRSADGHVAFGRVLFFTVPHV